MNGLILADVNIVKKMDKTLENGNSKIIPAYINKKETCQINQTL